MSRTFNITNFGCRASQSEGASIQEELIAADAVESASPLEANVVIVNSCTVTDEADRQVRRIGKMRFGLPEHRRSLNAESAGEIRRKEGVDAMQMLVLLQRVDAGGPVGGVAEQTPIVVRDEAQFG